MIRVLTAGDEDRLDAFLLAHAESSLFLRSNLRAGGVVDQGRPAQATYAVWEEGGQVRAAVSHAWNGNLIFQAPTRATELAQAAVRGSGRPVRGLVGPWNQVSTARADLKLSQATTFMDSKEDLFALDLDRLRLPPALSTGAWECRLPSPSEMDALALWRRDFQVDTIGEPPFEGMVAECRKSLERHLGDHSLFVLVDRGALASTCTFNARVPDCVQVGGVWTPPAFRSRGYGRAVVAGALRHAQAEGVTRAVLFTGERNHSARAAYEALGFVRVGDYGLVLFNDGHRLRRS